MTRRSLFQLLGLSWLTPDPVNRVSGQITIPSDGDAAIAESVNVALRELMDNSVLYSPNSYGRKDRFRIHKDGTLERLESA